MSKILSKEELVDSLGCCGLVDDSDHVLLSHEALRSELAEATKLLGEVNDTFATGWFGERVAKTITQVRAFLDRTAEVK